MSGEPGVEFRLLGPLEVRVGQRLLRVGSPKLRALLARLLLDSGRAVRTAALAESIWGDDPPANPRRAVQLCVTRLRALLGDAGHLIRTEPDGYSIRASAEQVDLGRFQAWLREATRAAERDDVDKESAALAEALGLWRGEPLADVRSTVLEQETVPGLREQRLRTLERRIDLDLRRGRQAELVGELRELTARYPLREGLWGQLMRALDAAGRRADALDAFHTLRHHLADELGIEPGEEIRRLHATILAGRRAGTRPVARPPAPVLVPVPRQLPPDLSGFVGRTGELARLDALITDATDGVRVVVIAGPAGVGKTTLAARWARRAADRFPDGQLWVNLRGFGPGPPVPPERALSRFLRTLGVPGERIPLDLDDQAALFRSVVDGRRLLVVLDNAGSAEQVRPLLPGGPGCLVVVTSRSQLTSLVAAEGAQPLAVDLLSPEEARQLLVRRLGGERVAARPAAAAEIVRRCAGLPLALAVVAARAGADPDLGLEALAGQLGEAGGGLDVLTTGEGGTDIRVVFSWSYRKLGPEAARLFRLLGLHPGPDLAVPAAASLAGVPVRRARATLAELVRTHLLTELVPGRFAFHDLLRAYAAELVHATDPEPDRQQAVRRLLDHYLHTGYAAAMRLDPHRDPITLDRAAAGAVREQPPDYDQAMAWFAAEHQALLAAVDLAAASGLNSHAWQLAWTPASYLDRQGHWTDLVAVQRAAVAAARRSGDLLAEARANRLLATSYRVAGRPDDAHAPLHRSLDLYRQLGDHSGQAQAHRVLGSVLGEQGRYQEALAHSRQALDLFQLIEHAQGQAAAGNGIGWFHAKLGDYPAAVDHCQRALALFQRLGDREGEAHTWDSLGYIHGCLGEVAQAIVSYRHAIELFRGLDDRYGQAYELDRLGDVYHQAGERHAARDAWQQATDLLTQLDHPDADRVRGKLAADRR